MRRSRCITAESPADAVEFLQLTKVDVVVGAFDTRSPQIVQFFEQSKRCNATASLSISHRRRLLTVAGEETYNPRADFLLRRPFSREISVRSLTKPWKNSSFSKNSPQFVVRREANPLQCLPSLTMIYPCQGLGRFYVISPGVQSKSDLHRALNLFLDAVGEFLRPSRMSILVRNTATREFEIRAHRGLQPRSLRAYASVATRGYRCGS